MNTASMDTAAASERIEAIRLQEKESRQQCERQLAARQAMPESDKKRIEELGAQLKPYVTCNLCKNLLLEPWLVKDCGHLYCFRCLHSIVYEKQHRRCPACGPGGSVDMNEDAFGAFKVVVDANNNRKVAREGSKFLYDDSADSLIRMLWPDRVQDYVTADVEREQRRLEDLAARKHFEVSVQGDRLANPSSTNPGMAAGRVRTSGVGTNSASRARGSIHLKAPPLKLQMPLISTGVARSSSSDQNMHLLLLSPIQMTLSPEMKKWASDNKLLQDHAVLPPLMKPYLRLPFDQLTLWALKEVLVSALNNRDFWHDKLLPYPAAGGLTSHDVALYVDWTQRTAETPSYILSQELPDDSELEPHMSKDDPPYSLLAVHDFLIEQRVNIGVSLDLVYCLRPEAVGRLTAEREQVS